MPKPTEDDLRWEIADLRLRLEQANARAEFAARDAVSGMAYMAAFRCEGAGETEIVRQKNSGPYCGSCGTPIRVTREQQLVAAGVLQSFTWSGKAGDAMRCADEMLYAALTPEDGYQRPNTVVGIRNWLAGKGFVSDATAEGHVIEDLVDLCNSLRGYAPTLSTEAEELVRKALEIVSNPLSDTSEGA